MKGYTTFLLLIILITIVIRWTISLHQYSGAGKPPMFGDYEAQRHWMEITYNLPIQDWYQNTTENDLEYWGLDYPPLTAYHSWLMGAIAQQLNSSWVALYESRGLESYEHKLFMRYTVLAVDVLIYIPAILIYFLRCTDLTNTTNKLVFAFIALLHPGLMLIDYGHFQYNCVSLGSALWGVIGLCSNYDLLGSAAFVLALNYKQMELYHAVPFFCYLFGSCLAKWRESKWIDGFLKLVKLGAIVIATFSICWFPFVGSWQLFSQVVHRLFPFTRGLFEDKVANVWCSLSVLIKFKRMLSISSLVRICLTTTSLLLIPSSVGLLLRPSLKAFKYSLVNASLIFFLFSFQVHEKSILLACLPVSLLLPEHLLAGVWFLLVATFSMLPLLVKDGLVLAFLASTVLFYMVADVLTSDEFQSRLGLENKPKQATKERFYPLSASRLSFALFCASVVGMVILTFLVLVIRPPERFPDLFPLAVSSYSCMHFVGFLVYYHWCQFGTFTSSSRPKTRTRERGTNDAKLKSS